MATSAEHVERRAQSHDIIRDLVRSRTETLSLYNDLASMRPFRSSGSVKTTLDHFCQALMDYTASTHFQLYRRIEENTERRTPVLRLAGEIYPRVLGTTEVIVDFNDRYDPTQPLNDPERLTADLSLLGEALAERIELEDRLIQALTKNRRPAV
ncbi:MAG: hypothetical protein B7Z66_06230 [Chromatiales bacterium 21-64-14]|nr:MAG: hypothetical protein B7Z66_06230 [Chromatiales bacterium 21-64-14]HQU15889.1 Rsd/AlgQ family anti-sigma factor [Gammaproteobacteria bacterium]